MQSDIQRALKAVSRSGRSDYRVAVKLWVTSSSRNVERAELDGSTGDRDRDSTIAAALRSMLANATIAANAGATGSLLIDSDITFGASGAPVLDGRGLVQGIVSRRIAERRVLAVSAAEAKSFLSANGVPIEQDDRSQIAGASVRADRAASISARVICVQN